MAAVRTEEVHAAAGQIPALHRTPAPAKKAMPRQNSMTDWVAQRKCFRRRPNGRIPL